MGKHTLGMCGDHPLLELLSTIMLDFKVWYTSLTVVLDGVQLHSLMMDKINVPCFKFVENIPNISIVQCTAYRKFIAQQKLIMKGMRFCDCYT